MQTVVREDEIGRDLWKMSAILSATPFLSACLRKRGLTSRARDAAYPVRVFCSAPVNPPPALPEKARRALYVFRPGGYCSRG